MRSVILLAMCFALSACLGFGRKEKVETVKAPEVVSECYTVDLFTRAEVEAPDVGVPAAYSAFLGEWGKGAWNDVWCHDIMVTKVYPDGRAELFEMHAPYEPWGQPATAFRRLGRIDKEGTLRFAYGTETVSYRIVEGTLQGQRSGMLGNLKVELVRRGGPSEQMLAQASPVPVPAQRAASMTAKPRMATYALVGETLPPIPVPRRAGAAPAAAPDTAPRTAPAATPLWVSPQAGDALPPIPVPRPVQVVLVGSQAQPGT